MNEGEKSMDSLKIRQAADVLNTTIDRYFGFNPDNIDADQVNYLKMTLPTIQNLLEVASGLLHDGITTSME